MTYVFDIDGTICTKLCELEGSDYTDSEPLATRIEKVNQLYEDGHTIVYWTARGSGSGIDWRDVTEKQFKKWLKYQHQHNPSSKKL